MLTKRKSLHIAKGGRMVHKIKKLCEAKQISLCELEQMASVSHGIYRWDKHEPNVYSVYRVAKVLGTTVEELLRAES